MLDPKLSRGPDPDPAHARLRGRGPGRGPEHAELESGQRTREGFEAHLAEARDFRHD